MKTVSIVLTQALTLLPPTVGAMLIACIALLTLFLLLIVAFSPDGARRLIDLVREIQQLGNRERRYDKRYGRRPQRGQK
jgi:hypothetical protein